MLSERYEFVGLLLFSVLSALPAAPPVLMLVRYIRSRRREGTTRGSVRLLCVSVLSLCVYAGVLVDAFLIEPNWPELNVIELDANIQAPLRLLHLSDLHIERKMSRRDNWLLNQLAQLSPDLILITGDTHQLGNRDPESLARVLSAIKANLGVFACVGYDNVSLLRQANPRITYLENQTAILKRRTDTIGLCGLLPISGRARAYDAVAATDYRIAMNHTPDLADEAAGESMDLYLCGHTHGGQVRIPFWGAIVTNCVSGKKYEAGLYRKGNTHIHTSRGLGLEPPPAPQVRFLCRPEITLIILRPASASPAPPQ